MGAPGATGATGPTGPTGATGATGLSGGFRAAFDFEEGSGTTSADASGNGNNVTLNSAGVSWTPSGHTGQALNFDGAAGYVEAPSTAALNPREEITVSAWVYQTGNAATTNTIVAKDGQYALAIVNGQLKFAVQTVTGSALTYQGAGTVPLNAWTHVKGSYDGVNLRTFVNGQMTARVAYPNGVIAQTTNPLRIGKRANNTDAFAGRIDEVRIVAAATDRGQPAVYRASTTATLTPGGTRVQIPNLALDFSAAAGTPVTLMLFINQRCNDSYMYSDITLNGFVVGVAGDKSNGSWRVNNVIMVNTVVPSSGTHSVRAHWEGGTACSSNAGEVNAQVGANVSLTAWVGD